MSLDVNLGKSHCCQSYLLCSWGCRWILLGLGTEPKPAREDAVHQSTDATKLSHELEGQ